jgi:hypothetical protein
MRQPCCHGLRGDLTQYDVPRWDPLLEAVGERLVGGFMWMHEEELDDGTTLHAYKHRDTRRYLYLAEDGRAFERTPCDAYVPLRLDFAIEAAVCTWWILSGWEEADRQAVWDAVVRANERGSSAT